MNLFANPGRESYKSQPTAEPYTARRAVRYAAADNAQAALQRQFPGMSFAAQHVVSQQVTTQQDQTSNVGVQDDVPQAA
jgi:hypothetical protein